MASKLNRREKTLLYLLLCLAITAGTVCLLILPAVSRNIRGVVRRRDPQRTVRRLFNQPGA